MILTGSLTCSVKFIGSGGVKGERIAKKKLKLTYIYVEKHIQWKSRVSEREKLLYILGTPFIFP